MHREALAKPRNYTGVARPGRKTCARRSAENRQRINRLRRIIRLRVGSGRGARTRASPSIIDRSPFRPYAKCSANSGCCSRRRARSCSRCCSSSRRCVPTSSRGSPVRATSCCCSRRARRRPRRERAGKRHHVRRGREEGHAVGRQHLHEQGDARAQPDAGRQPVAPLLSGSRRALAAAARHQPRLRRDRRERRLRAHEQPCRRRARTTSSSCSPTAAASRRSCAARIRSPIWPC